jgi:hypothetical protein
MKLNILITLLAIITPLIANAGYTQSRINIEIAAANQEIRDSGMSYSDANISMANADGGKTLNIVYRGKTFDAAGDDLACAVSMRKEFAKTISATYIADFIRNGYTRVKFVVGNESCYHTL